MYFQNSFQIDAKQLLLQLQCQLPIEKARINVTRDNVFDGIMLAYEYGMLDPSKALDVMFHDGISVSI